ncbi:MAG: hypothetical protein IT372_18610 [Polyangiaceae bacterium]|nr:hypothetical protein [Polyangiaceae bacterium]
MLRAIVQVLFAGAMLIGCGAEAKKQGELCDDDEECPAGLECLIEDCGARPAIGFCSKKCEFAEDCVGFEHPSCEAISGLTKSCIEVGQNPCEP